MEDKNPNQLSMMERAIEALELYDGMGVIPLIEGRKEPIEKIWGLSAGHTPADVATAWTENPNANIGVLVGEDHLVLDIDTKHMDEGINPWDSIKRLEADGATFRPTLKIKTPTDGEHWVFKVKPTPQRKKAIGFLPGLDLLTGPNFIVAAGSVIDPDAYAENPGGTYTVSDASPLDAAPNLLADIFYVEEKRRESAKDRLKRTTTNFDENIIKNWNGATLYPTDLWRTVWSVVTVRSGFMRFLRGEPRVPTFEEGERHNALASLFGWMRYQSFRNYEHWEKSCRIAANLVAPTYELDDHKGLAALIQDYWEYEGSRPLDELKDGQFTWESDKDYDRRLEEEESKKAIPFPVEGFPRDVKNLVTGLAENYHIPTDYSAIPILAVASTAVGGTVKVSIKGWTQPINIYGISVGRPGSGKQEGADKVMTPIYVEEDRRRAVYDDEIDRYEADLKAWKIANSVWESKYKSWFNHEHYTKGNELAPLSWTPIG